MLPRSLAGRPLQAAAKKADTGKRYRQRNVESPHFPTSAYYVDEGDGDSIREGGVGRASFDEYEVQWMGGRAYPRNAAAAGVSRGIVFSGSEMTEGARLTRRTDSFSPYSMT